MLTLRLDPTHVLTLRLDPTHVLTLRLDPTRYQLILEPDFFRSGSSRGYKVLDLGSFSTTAVCTVCTKVPADCTPDRTVDNTSDFTANYMMTVIFCRPARGTS